MTPDQADIALAPLSSWCDGWTDDRWAILHEWACRQPDHAAMTTIVRTWIEHATDTRRPPLGQLKDLYDAQATRNRPPAIDPRKGDPIKASAYLGQLQQRASYDSAAAELVANWAKLDTRIGLPQTWRDALGITGVIQRAKCLPCDGLGWVRNRWTPNQPDICPTCNGTTKVTINARQAPGSTQSHANPCPA
jgi:hypothetical protein